ncbi:hypothetical protein COOONC_17620, partial [Cooperia oncophora]
MFSFSGKKGRRKPRKRKGRLTVEEEAKPKEQKRSPSKQQPLRPKTPAGSERKDADESVAKKMQVKVFVEETLRKGVQGLIAEFKGMRRMNDFNLMTEFVLQNPLGRNRYKAPLPKTCPDFWNMVVQEKSVAILMLCNFIEQVKPRLVLQI